MIKREHRPKRPSVVNIHEAKTHLSRLLQQVAEGEEVIISKAGTPIARLVPFDRPSEPRRPGVWKGRVTIASDFDAPVPELEKLFES
jgi:prevent-host-death family protein